MGASLAFLMARHRGADWVARRAGPRMQGLNDGVAAEGWRFVAFVRLLPLFAFKLLNDALGLTRNVRSRSRLGRVDRGVNAKRVRAWLAALQARAAAHKLQP